MSEVEFNEVEFKKYTPQNPSSKLKNTRTLVLMIVVMFVMSGLILWKFVFVGDDRKPPLPYNQTYTNVTQK